MMIRVESAHSRTLFMGQGRSHLYIAVAMHHLVIARLEQAQRFQRGLPRTSSRARLVAFRPCARQSVREEVRR